MIKAVADELRSSMVTEESIQKIQKDIANIDA